jgi:hypothetical protein
MQRVPYNQGDNDLSSCPCVDKAPLVKINRKIILSSSANTEHAVCIIKIFTAVIYSLQQ